MIRNRDLRLASTAAAICAVASLALPWEVVKVAFALPLTLFLPGYAVTSAAFVNQRLDWPYLLVFSIGMSLAVLALGSLLLNYAPGGIRATPWAIYLFAVVIGSCALAARRRPRNASGLTWPVLGARPGERLLVAGAVLAAVAALVLAMTTLPVHDARGYTQLWIAPEQPDGRGQAAISVSSGEQQRLSYELRVRFGDGRPPLNRQFDLAPGETLVVPLPASSAASPQPVPITATLFRQDQPDTVYRRIAASLPTRDDAG